MQDQSEDINNLTHTRKKNSCFEATVKDLQNQIIARGDLPHVSIKQQLEILDQLASFPFGQFIIERGGANGFWTDYLISHPQKRKPSDLNHEGKPFNSVENFLLNQCPVVLAHQERFQIYQKIIQERMQENMRLASIPCGLMRDLLTLDFTQFNRIELIGVDIDQESIDLAANFAKQLNIKNVHFLREDAWQIPFNEELDIITSSGLNVYESDPQRILNLYKRFFNALKPKGFLVISVLTYPPGEIKNSDWKLDGIRPEVLLMDRIVHKDVLDIKWRNFRSCDELDKEFKQVGFSKVDIFFDRHHIFPTICAQK